jgi:citrate lyase subunit beta/citryl-CoA lyase
MTLWGPMRTALFVPGNRLDRVDKAANAGADAVIIDLEDAVPIAHKAETRGPVREKVLQYRDRQLIVRVNGLTTGFVEADLDEVAVEGLRCIMFPKVEEARDVQEINRLLSNIEKKRGMTSGAFTIIPLIESARAVQNIFPILSAKIEPQRVFTVAFGAADYTLDMGIDMTKDGRELDYARSRIAVSCRAAGVEPPLDSPFLIDLKDIEALKVDARRARQLGFQGKLCIHPNQVGPCNEVFSPTAEEIQLSERVIQAFAEAESKGSSAIQLDGKFIDYPVVERSRRLLKLAAAIQS